MMLQPTELQGPGQDLLLFLKDINHRGWKDRKSDNSNTTWEPGKQRDDFTDLKRLNPKLILEKVETNQIYPENFSKASGIDGQESLEVGIKRKGLK